MACHAAITFSLLLLRPNHTDLTQPQWNWKSRTPKNGLIQQLQTVGRLWYPSSPKDGSGYQSIRQSHNNQYFFWRDLSPGEALAFLPSGKASQKKCCTSCVWCCPITWQLWVGHKKGVPCCVCQRNAFWHWFRRRWKFGFGEFWLKGWKVGEHVTTWKHPKLEIPLPWFSMTFMTFSWSTFERHGGLPSCWSPSGARWDGTGYRMLAVLQSEGNETRLKCVLVVCKERDL